MRTSVGAASDRDTPTGVDPLERGKSFRFVAYGEDDLGTGAGASGEPEAFPTVGAGDQDPFAAEVTRRDLDVGKCHGDRPRRRHRTSRSKRLSKRVAVPLAGLDYSKHVMTAPGG